MNVVDIVLAIIILIGAYKGYRDGFLMTVVTLLALVLGVIGGFLLLGNAMVMLGSHFTINDSILPFIAFGVVFIIIVIVVSLIGKLVKASLSVTLLGKVDQAIGGLIGLVKAAFLLSIVLWIINAVGHDPLKQFYTHSFLYPFVSDFAPMLTKFIGAWVPSVKNIFG